MNIIFTVINHYSGNDINRLLCGILILNFLSSIGIESFLMYSVHEGIRGIPLDPSDKMDALMPISGTAFAVGIDFHAGK